MIILLLLAGGIIAGVAIFRANVNSSGDWDFLGGLLAVLSAVAFVIALLTVLANRMEVHSGIARFHSVRATAEAAEQSDDPLEGAAWRLKVAESNEWLASQQYLNGTLIDLWVPDSVMELEPIR